MYFKIFVFKVFKLFFCKLFMEEEELYSMWVIFFYCVDIVLFSSYFGLVGYNFIIEEIFWIWKVEDEVWLDVIKLSVDILLASNYLFRIKFCNCSGDVF